MKLTFVILLLIIFNFYTSLLNEENKLNIGWIRNNFGVTESL